jgi:hypothetical protein
VRPADGASRFLTVLLACFATRHGAEEQLFVPDRLRHRPATAGETIQPEVSRRYADLFGRHRDDRIF